MYYCEIIIFDVVVTFVDQLAKLSIENLASALIFHLPNSKISQMQVVFLRTTCNEPLSKFYGHIVSEQIK